VHEVVRVGAGLGAVLRGALKEARDGPNRLQEGWHAEVVEGCRLRLPLGWTGPH